MIGSSLFKLLTKFTSTESFMRYVQLIVQNSIVGEPKSPIVQKHTFFAPERYTAGFLYTDCLNSA